MNVLIGIIIVTLIVINSRKNINKDNTQDISTDQPQIKSRKTIKLKRHRPIFKWILVAFGIYLAIGFINGAINPKTEEEKQQELKEKEAQAKKHKEVQESREVALSIMKEDEERDESIAESSRLLEESIEESEFESIYESERLEESIEESTAEDNSFKGIAKSIFGEDLRKAEETEIGGYILSTKIPIGFTAGIMKDRFESHVVDLLEQIKSHDFADITIIGYAESTDVYGNESETEAIMMILSKSEIDKINFDNFDPDNLSVIADSYYIDPNF